MAQNKGKYNASDASAGLFDNAVASIIMGIEDLQSDDERRHYSAARNYYSGLLLLGKACLINAAPNAEPMMVLGARFIPSKNDNGGVDILPIGTKTLDFDQMGERFKKFNLVWPGVNTTRLKELRNDIEHYHLTEPREALREAIGATFPMVMELFGYLGKNPAEHLSMVWDKILSEKNAYEHLSKECRASWEVVEWPSEFGVTDYTRCPSCGSNLIMNKDGQVDFMLVEGVCCLCGAEIGHAELMQTIENSTPAGDGSDYRDWLSAMTLSRWAIFPIVAWLKDRFGEIENLRVGRVGPAVHFKARETIGIIIVPLSHEVNVAALLEQQLAAASYMLECQGYNEIIYIYCFKREGCARTTISETQMKLLSDTIRIPRTSGSIRVIVGYVKGHDFVGIKEL